MFDDQVNGQAGGPPQNLPMEPEDMFADVDTGPAAPAAPVVPNALNAGVLRKKMPTVAPTSVAPASATASPPAPAAPSAVPFTPQPRPVAQPTMPSPVVPPTPPAPVYTMKEPILGKVVLVIVLGVMLGGLAFGGWWVYNYMQNGGQFTGEPATTPENPIVPSNNQTTTTAPETVNTDVTPASNTNEVPAQMNNDQILFGEPVDTDKDGLDDVREQQLGTDPSKADTDGDGLTDGDEVLIWHTDPLKTDTDGDSYLDGDEVRHGYNPLGPGKLFNAQNNVVTSTNSNSTNTIR